MALWGNNDAGAIQGTSIAATNGSAAVTGTGTKFQVDFQPGDVLRIVSGTTSRNRVLSITSNTALTLSDVFPGSSATVAAANVTIQQQPKYAYFDGNTPTGQNNISTIFGIDTSEIAAGGDNVTSIGLIQGGGVYVEAPVVTLAGPTALTIATTAVNTTTENITVTNHGLLTGTKLTYGAAGGTVLGGLSDATAYYVINTGVNTFQLASSLSNAQAGTYINLSGTGNSSQTLTGDTATATAAISAGAVTAITVTNVGSAYLAVPAVTVDVPVLTVATASVNTTLDTVNYTTHGQAAGASLKYFNSTGTAATGLANNTTYYVATAGLTANAFEVKAANTTGTLAATVAVSGTTGQFTCGASTLAAADRVTITGTRAGTGTITGYATGTTYKVSAVTGTSPNVTGFTLTTEAGGALTTSAGTLTGLTYTTETVIDISGTGNNAQYFQIVGGTAATATATLGSGQPAKMNAGWVKRTVGTGGRAGRVQYETLVAMRTVTGNDIDDIAFPDS